MLFKKKFLDLIRKKEVDIAFRKWTRPSVKEGGTLLTPAGQLRVISLKKIDLNLISEKEIRKAGYAEREELMKELDQKHQGELYKIEFRLERDDPRLALRENTHLSEREFIDLNQKLQQLDSRGKIKHWTYKILWAVNAEPGKRAIYYASQLGYEKDWFKLNIRKLKNLGLTISLPDGYEVSPRGKALLKMKPPSNNR